MKHQNTIVFLCLAIASLVKAQGGEEYCVTNYGITVCGSVRVAGAIDYVEYNGVQYIDQYDHGRELQVAITNASGECYNPTEAGSSNDSAGPTSTSQLLGVNLDGEILRTTSQPAFWIAPGQFDTNGNCYAVNTQPVSNYIINKAVVIGYAGYTNALVFEFNVQVPEFQSYLQIEAPTGYMPIAFDTFFNIDLSTGVLTQTDGGPGETPDPVIISTGDGTAAMGSFLQSAFSPYASYARFTFPGLGAGSTSKWSNVWRTNTPPPTTEPIAFVSVICIGSLQEVQQCMFGIASSQGFVQSTESVTIPK